MKDLLLGIHVVISQTTSKNSTQVRAARAVRFMIFQRSTNPIRELQHQRRQQQRQRLNFIGRMRKSHSAARTTRTSEQFCDVMPQNNNCGFDNNASIPTFNPKFPIFMSTVLLAVHF